MKTIKFLAAVALAAVAAMTAPQLSAQEQANKDENGKFVRGPYLTNKIQDNWFVGLGLGFNVFGDGGYKPAAGFNLDATAGKWFTPTVAARVGYSGLTGGMWSYDASVLGMEQSTNDLYKQKFGFAYLHADALINLSNAIGGYRADRLWNVIPYAHTGIMLTYGRPSDVKFADRELAAGLGLLNNIHLTKRLDLTLDIRGIFVGGEQHAAGGGTAAALQTSVGVSVNLGRTDWTRAKDYHNPSDTEVIEKAKKVTADLEAKNVALEANNVDLAKKNGELKAEVAELSKRAAKAVLEDVGPASVYFEIGQTTLSEKELKHLDFYLQNVLPNVGDDVVTVLTGSADSSTGSAKRNQYLSQKRVDYVLNLLTTKYGLKAEKFQIRTQVAKEGDAALNRAVVISFE